MPIKKRTKYSKNDMINISEIQLPKNIPTFFETTCKTKDYLHSSKKPRDVVF